MYTYPLFGILAIQVLHQRADMLLYGRLHLSRSSLRLQFRLYLNRPSPSYGPPRPPLALLGDNNKDA